MTEIHVIVTGPEVAYDYAAEFWFANELMAVTVLHKGRLHLRIDPRADGMPWLADTASLARALAEASDVRWRREVTIAIPSGVRSCPCGELDVGCALAVAHHRVTCMRVRAEIAGVVRR